MNLTISLQQFLKGMAGQSMNKISESSSSSDIESDSPFEEIYSEEETSDEEDLLGCLIQLQPY